MPKSYSPLAPSVTTQAPPTDSARIARFAIGNIVVRELNQSIGTYLSLVDVTVAFKNDGNVYDEVPLHNLDQLIAKYVGPAIQPTEADAHPRLGVLGLPERGLHQLGLRCSIEIVDGPRKGLNRHGE